ncbi:MAG: hypothetical protein U9R36_00360 [Elusimicrobiota bacterium]|nr:hypothetical protein [Elusimicrobiota bacterium]
MKEIWNIILKAAKFDSEFFKEIADGAEELTLAVIIVLISSLAAGIGSIFQVGIVGIIVGTIGAFINWALWAVMAYIALSIFSSQKENLPSSKEILIALGFASAPGIIKAGGIIPPFHSFLFVLSHIWMGAVMVMVLDIKCRFKSRWMSPAAVVAGWAVMALIIWIIGLSMQRLY